MELRSFRLGAGLLGASLVAAAPAFANPGLTRETFVMPTFALAHADAQNAASKPADKGAAKPADKGAKPADKPAAAEKTEASSESTGGGDYGFKGLGDFWNVREANSNLTQGQWNLETTWAWRTASDGSDDDTTSAFALRYGVTDDVFVEVEVYPINYGDGSDVGNGDLGLILFWTVMREQDALPAFGTYLEGRFPSGNGSEGVDGEWHWILTKTLMPKLRMHFEGFIMTANGGRDGSEVGRRHFQWGVGPGFDYELAEKTRLVANYTNRSSDQFGASNLNVLELGVAQGVGDNQYITAGLDIGLDDNEETPNFVVKLQYGFTWK